MSLLNRRPISIGREQREFRDDRVFVVATDDTFAPKQYFKHLALRRVRVVVLSTPAERGESAPTHVVERLKAAYDIYAAKKQIQKGDEFWIFLDRDHHFKGTHTAQTLEALRVGKTAGFEVAISNPCFELWLLLHHEEVSPDADLDNCASVESSLRARLGSYNKTNILPGQFPLDLVETAIRRARALEKSPDSPNSLLPLPIGTRVYRLLEKILSPAL
jgi:hypothetical protein